MADYVVWRHRNGTQEDSEFWRANFANKFGTKGAQTAAVPEPASWVLVVVGLIFVRGRPRITVWQSVLA